MEAPLKVCVLGDSGVGKTAVCRLLADQAHGDNLGPRSSAAVRVQVASHLPTKVNLWDCATRDQSLWPALAKDVDGLLLVRDAQSPEEQERYLERLYTVFNARHLKSKCCCVLTVAQGTGVQDLQGKLRGLPQASASLTVGDVTAATAGFLRACYNHKMESLEQSLLES